MYYVTYNVNTGALLNISEESLTVDGHPLQVRTFDGSLPDLTKVEWVPNIAAFMAKS